MRYDQLLAIASRHERLLRMIRKGNFSSSGLATKVGVSEQTIYRDIEFLKKQGHKIKAIRISRSWAYRLEGTKETAGDGEAA